MQLVAGVKSLKSQELDSFDIIAKLSYSRMPGKHMCRQSCANNMHKEYNRSVSIHANTCIYMYTFYTCPVRLFNSACDKVVEA